MSYTRKKFNNNETEKKIYYNKNTGKAQRWITALKWKITSFETRLSQFFYAHTWYGETILQKVRFQFSWKCKYIGTEPVEVS